MVLHVLASFKSYNMTTNELVFFLNNFTKNNHHFSNNISTPTSPQPLNIGMLIVDKHEILAHNEFRAWKSCTSTYLHTFANCQT